MTNNGYDVSVNVSGVVVRIEGTHKEQYPHIRHHRNMGFIMTRDGRRVRGDGNVALSCTIMERKFAPIEEADKTETRKTLDAFFAA